ncbi:hypothetical protein MHBO_002937, partial [Bonamia ostreae]
NIYICFYANGDRKRGKQQISTKKRKVSNQLNLANGLILGFVVSLLILLFFQLTRKVSADMTAKEIYEANLPVYRFFGLVSVHIFFWGIDKIVLERYQVNYHFVMQVAPKNRLLSQQIILTGVSIAFSSLFLLNGVVIIGLTFGTKFIFQNIFALVYFIALVFCLFNPFKFLYHNARFYLIKVFQSVFSLPFHNIKFIDFFIMDQFISYQRILMDFNYSICYFFSGDFATSKYDSQICNQIGKNNWISYLLSYVPFFVRAAQCIKRYFESNLPFPHLANAGKYISVIFYAVSGVVRKIYPNNGSRLANIIFGIYSSIYTTTWDLIVDWSLFRYPSKNCLLRDKIIFPIYFYYFSILTNLFLRALQLVPVFKGETFYNNFYMTFLLAFCEILRRCQWNIYRIENEHLNNVGM